MLQSDASSLGLNRVASERVGHVWIWSLSVNWIKEASAFSDKNYPTILAYADKSYFDLAYSPSMYEPGFSWAGAYLGASA